MPQPILCGLSNPSQALTKRAPIVHSSELENAANAAQAERILGAFPEYQCDARGFSKVGVFGPDDKLVDVLLVPIYENCTPKGLVQLAQAETQRAVEEQPHLTGCRFSSPSWPPAAPQFGGSDCARLLIPHLMMGAQRHALPFSEYAKRIETDGKFRTAERDWIMIPFRAVYHSDLGGRGTIYSSEQEEKSAEHAAHNACQLAAARIPLEQLLTQIEMRGATEVRIVSAGSGPEGAEAVTWAKAVATILAEHVRHPHEWKIEVIALSIMPRHLYGPRQIEEIPGCTIRYAWADLLDHRTWFPESSDIILLRRSLYPYRHFGDPRIECAVDRLVDRLPLGGVFVTDHEIEEIIRYGFNPPPYRPPLYFSHEYLREAPPAAEHLRYAFAAERALAEGFIPDDRTRELTETVRAAGYGAEIEERHGRAPSGVYVKYRE